MLAVKISDEELRDPNLDGIDRPSFWKIDATRYEPSENRMGNETGISFYRGTRKGQFRALFHFYNQVGDTVYLKLKTTQTAGMKVRPWSVGRVESGERVSFLLEWVPGESVKKGRKDLILLLAYTMPDGDPLPPQLRDKLAMIQKDKPLITRILPLLKDGPGPDLAKKTPLEIRLEARKSRKVQTSTSQQLALVLIILLFYLTYILFNYFDGENEPSDENDQ